MQDIGQFAASIHPEGAEPEPPQIAPRISRQPSNFRDQAADEWTEGVLRRRDKPSSSFTSRRNETKPSKIGRERRSN